MRSGLAMAAFYTHAAHQADAIHYSRPDPSYSRQRHTPCVEVEDVKECSAYPLRPAVGRAVFEGVPQLMLALACLFDHPNLDGTALLPSLGILDFTHLPSGERELMFVLCHLCILPNVMLSFPAKAAAFAE